MLTIFFTILPLLVLIVIGYGAGKIYKLSTAQYGYMVAFVLSPLVSFGAILQLEFKPEYLLLPFIVAFLCIAMTMIGFKTAKPYLPGTIPNLAGMASSAGNTGFFGIPIFLLFMPIDMLGIYLLANLGTQIIEVSFGYYIAARGNCTIKQSMMKLLKMPPLWAVLIAILCNIGGFEMPDIMYDYWKKILDGWLVIGMMMIGIALASCATLRPDVKFCIHMMVMRFVLWPLLTIGVITFDYHITQLLNVNIYFVLAVFAIVPLPGNSVALSATLGLHPDKMAFAVVLSTVLAALLVPLVINDAYQFIMNL
ncbi:MAG: putative permease [Alphaproteobacteria bacterium]|jgi:predicted permease